MLNFFIFQKRVRGQFLYHILCMTFQEKYFLCYILLAGDTSLSDCLQMLLEILGNIFITIVCFPGCDVINFGISFIFLIMPFFYMTKKSRQKFKYRENKKSFQDAIKSILKGFSISKNCLKLENPPLKQKHLIQGSLFSRAHHLHPVICATVKVAFPSWGRSV